MYARPWEAYARVFRYRVGMRSEIRLENVACWVQNEREVEFFEDAARVLLSSKTHTGKKEQRRSHPGVRDDRACCMQFHHVQIQRHPHMSREKLDFF